MTEFSAGVGRSENMNSFEAGREAAGEAVADRAGAPGLLFVFAGRDYDGKALLEGIFSVCGDVPMIGGTTAGELSTKGFSTETIVIMALYSDVLRFTTGIGFNMSDDETGCGENLMNDILKNHTLDDALALFVFPDGMGGDGYKVLEGINAVLTEKLEIIGGCLGDGEAFENTYQFYNGKVYQDAVPCVLISGKGGFRTGIGVGSGFESIGNRMFCTESDGNSVKKIDGVNALDLYKELLGEERAKRIPEICLEYPFGLMDETVSILGEEYFQLRTGYAVNEEEGSITFAGSIPEGSAITIATGSRGDLINGAKLAAEKGKTGLGDAVPKMAMVFSCVGRKLVLGRRAPEEIEMVKSIIGYDTPLLGFYTYGEIGPIDKDKSSLSDAKLHNETLVVWLIGS